MDRMEKEDASCYSSLMEEFLEIIFFFRCFNEGFGKVTKNDLDGKARKHNEQEHNEVQNASEEETKCNMPLEAEISKQNKRAKHRPKEIPFF